MIDFDTIQRIIHVELSDEERRSIESWIHDQDASGMDVLAPTLALLLSFSITVSRIPNIVTNELQTTKSAIQQADRSVAETVASDVVCKIQKLIPQFLPRERVERIFRYVFLAIAILTIWGAGCYQIGHRYPEERLNSISDTIAQRTNELELLNEEIAQKQQWLNLPPEVARAFRKMRFNLGYATDGKVRLCTIAIPPEFKSWYCSTERVKEINHEQWPAFCFEVP